MQKQKKLTELNWGWISGMALGLGGIGGRGVAQLEPLHCCDGARERLYGPAGAADWLAIEEPCYGSQTHLYP